jgi:Dyp-type peroxidase family
MAPLPDAALKDIQGIVLSGYGHLNYGAFLFFRLSNAVSARGWLVSLIPQLRTAERWSRRPEGGTEKPGRAVQVALAHSGLAALSLPEATLLSFEREFIGGMPDRAALLGDSGSNAPDQWELGGPTTDEIHGVLMIYEEDQQSLDAAVAEHQALMQRTGGGAPVSLQSGWRPEDQRNPLGFVDGISQPDIDGAPHIRHLASPQGAISTGEFILGYPNEYNIYPPSPAVAAAEDPHGILPRFPDNEMPDSRDFGRHGSYLVYRKLQTDVAAFWQFVEQHAVHSDGPPNGPAKQAQMAWLASKFIGRWPSGAPLTMSPERDDPSLALANDFTYLKDDPDGFGCPVGAHIRRSNPRDSLAQDTPAESFKSSNRHRIIRRAVFYGDILVPPAAVRPGLAPLGLEDDGQPRGLHFFAINTDISRQFEFIQQTWANKPTFNGLWGNKDPVIGDNDGTSRSGMVIQRAPLREQIRNLPRFVQVRGGGYFFLPSVTALKYLASR